MVEWFKDMHPKNGERGYAIYYKPSIKKGWKRYYLVYDNLEQAKRNAEKLPYGYIGVRPVRRRGTRIVPYGAYYQKYNGKWEANNGWR